MGIILQDMMGMLSRKKVVTPKTDDYVTIARYASVQERMKPQPKMETELITMGSIKTFVGVSPLSGTSAQRLNATSTPVGVSYWDTDLKIPCYLESGVWYNAAGGVV